MDGRRMGGRLTGEWAPGGWAPEGRRQTRRRRPLSSRKAAKWPPRPPLKGAHHQVCCVCDVYLCVSVSHHGKPPAAGTGPSYIQGNQAGPREASSQPGRRLDARAGPRGLDDHGAVGIGEVAACRWRTEEPGGVVCVFLQGLAGRFCCQTRASTASTAAANVVRDGRESLGSAQRPANSLQVYSVSTPCG